VSLVKNQPTSFPPAVVENTPSKQADIRLEAVGEGAKRSSSPAKPVRPSRQSLTLQSIQQGHSESMDEGFGSPGRLQIALDDTCSLDSTPTPTACTAPQLSMGGMGSPVKKGIERGPRSEESDDIPGLQKGPKLIPLEPTEPVEGSPEEKPEPEEGEIDNGSVEEGNMDEDGDVDMRIPGAQQAARPSPEQPISAAAVPTSVGMPDYSRLPTMATSVPSTTQPVGSGFQQQSGASLPVYKVREWCKRWCNARVFRQRVITTLWEARECNSSRLSHLPCSSTSSVELRFHHLVGHSHTGWTCLRRCRT